MEKNIKSGNSAFPELSENHKRRITSVFKQLDKIFATFENFVRGGEYTSELYSEKNDLSLSEREQLAGAVKETKVILRQIKEDLNLEPDISDVSRLVTVRAMSIWVDLIEIKSGNLGGYGAIPDGFPDYFDPKLDSIIKILQKISNIPGPGENE